RKDREFDLANHTRLSLAIYTTDTVTGSPTDCVGEAAVSDQPNTPQVVRVGNHS
ncbi:unnamed protein product, partial [Mycena citricolor]